MKTPPIQFALYAVPVLIVGTMVALMLTVPYSLAPQVVEDGPIENLSAIGFALAAIGFGYAAFTAPMLRNTGAIWAPAMTVCWALLMVVCLGEEISWGQRLLGIATPADIATLNTQGETNIHNIAAVNDFMGGPHRWLTIYMWMTGLGIPLFALTGWGKRVLGFFRFPVSPWSYSILFIGAFLYRKYFAEWFPIPDLQPPNAPGEIREMLTAMGSAFFGLHAAIWPADVYVGAPPQPEIKRE